MANSEISIFDEQGSIDDDVWAKKRKVRYWCYRFKNQESGGAIAKGAPRGLKKHFESQDFFPGWLLFAETNGWDVSPEDPMKMVPRQKGAEDEWTEELHKNSRPFPGVPKASAIVNETKTQRKKRRKKK